MRQFAARTAVAASALVLAFGMSACGGSKDTKESSSKASNAASSAASQASKSVVPDAPKTTTSMAGKPGDKSCPAGATSAKIGGADKCIAKGQMCSKEHAADYPKYGFKCDASGRLVTK